jgi:hypothetical protein
MGVAKRQRTVTASEHPQNRHDQANLSRSCLAMPGGRTGVKSRSVVYVLKEIGNLAHPPNATVRCHDLALVQSGGDPPDRV